MDADARTAVRPTAGSNAAREGCLPMEGVLGRESRRSQRGGGGSDLGRPDASSRAKCACSKLPDGDGAPEGQPSIAERVENARRRAGSADPKPAERR
jgi:hypothetical protein